MRYETRVFVGRIRHGHTDVLRNIMYIMHAAHATMVIRTKDDDVMMRIREYSTHMCEKVKWWVIGLVGHMCMHNTFSGWLTDHDHECDHQFVIIAWWILLYNEDVKLWERVISVMKSILHDGKLFCFAGPSLSPPSTLDTDCEFTLIFISAAKVIYQFSILLPA